MTVISSPSVSDAWRDFETHQTVMIDLTSPNYISEVLVRFEHTTFGIQTHLLSPMI